MGISPGEGLQPEGSSIVSAVKIAIQLASLGQPFRKAIVTAARLGASGVEIDARGELRPEAMTQTALREIRGLLDEHSLRVVAVGFRTRRGYDMPDQIEGRVAATKAAMKLATDLRAPIVVNQVGHAAAPADSPSGKLLRQTLLDLCGFGQRIGAVLAAQTGSDSGPQLAALLAELPLHGIGVDFDPGNLILHGFSPLEAVHALGPNILHVHARDGVRDLARGRGLEVALGRGSADFPALLGALEEHDYRGYFTVVREAADEPELEIEQAIKYLRNL